MSRSYVLAFDLWTADGRHASPSRFSVERIQATRCHSLAARVGIARLCHPMDLIRVMFLLIALVYKSPLPVDLKEHKRFNHKN